MKTWNFYPKFILFVKLDLKFKALMPVFCIGKFSTKKFQYFKNFSVQKRMKNQIEGKSRYNDGFFRDQKQEK